MAYYRICQRCGAALDPGEICEDCRSEAAENRGQRNEKNAHRTKSEQRENAKKITAPDATNTESGKAENE